MTVPGFHLASSSLTTADYDEARPQLRLQFCDGTRYQYLEVPPSTLHALLAAPSKGRFFNRHIRGRFDYVKITDEN